MTWFRDVSHNLLHHLESKVRHIYLNTHGCCSIEVEALTSASYDIERLGFRIVDKPDQASLMLVSGWLNEDFIKKIKEDYSKLILDKAVIAVGACSISASPYSDENKKILSDILPVSMYLPGCPPRPEALIHALIELENKNQIERKKSSKKWISEVMKSHG